MGKILILVFRSFLIFNTLLSLISCNSSTEETEIVEIGFCDVGQGSANIIKHKDKCILIDIGPEEGIDGWQYAYEKLGKPRIEFIIISHSDLDHCGGLHSLPINVNWSGRLYISSQDDSTKILSFLPEQLKSKTYLKKVDYPDTLYLSNTIFLRVLSPNENVNNFSPQQGNQSINNSGLVLKFHAGQRTVMFPGDIDSTTQKLLFRQFTYDLSSEILTVPHHGSKDAFCPTFYGYVQPQNAIISCAKENSYGHPSSDIINFCLQNKINLHITYLTRGVFMRSNEYYWESF